MNKKHWTSRIADNFLMGLIIIVAFAFIASIALPAAFGSINIGRYLAGWRPEPSEMTGAEEASIVIFFLVVGVVSTIIIGSIFGNVLKPLQRKEE